MRDFSMKRNSITNKDCLKFLKTIPDKSVDLVLTDPPYNIGFDGGKGWDSYWKNDREYIQWCISWSKECIRVLKDNRMFVVWGTLKTESFLLYKLALNRFEGIYPQNEIIWSYNWGGRTKDNFARKHEYAWCYSTGKKFLFNSDDVRVDRKVGKNMRTGQNYTKGTIPTCVWEKNNHTTSKDYCGWHATTKNIEVLERIIRAYSNENDLVLDPFMGSGSTAIACKLSNRDYIGSELDQEYVKKARARVKSYDRINTLSAIL
tara:strand:- start:8737 stop:9519 length:783 start_codon:yes stop_codon:yes gene_type:complete